MAEEKVVKEGAESPTLPVSAQATGWILWLVATSLVVLAYIGSNSDQALGRIEDQYSKIVESSDHLAKPTSSADQMPRGVVGEFERFMKELMDQTVAQRNDYTLELSAIGWDSILDPSRLEKDKTFTESQLILTKGKDIVRKYRGRANSLLQSTRAKINNLEVSSSLKQDMIHGFDRGMKNTQGQFDRLWELEEMTIFEVEKIINLLSKRSGSWVVFGRKIVFENNNDLQRFNVYIANIQHYAAEQEEMQKRSRDSVENFFNTAKEALK